MLAEGTWSPEGSQVTMVRRDRRVHVRARMKLSLKFMTNQIADGVGKTVNVSANGILFNTPNSLRVGDEIVCYVDGLGRLNGTISRARQGQAAMTFDVSALKRDRIADQLVWLLNKDRLGLEQERRAERHAASGDLQVCCADGREISCQVTDMSLMGVALLTNDKRPMVGEAVAMGNKKGVVVRYLDRGFAVEFRLN